MPSKPLSLKRVLEHIGEHLENRGWRPVPLAKRISYRRVEGLVLQAGVETSRHYRGRLTASLYLGRTFTWSFAVLDFPREAYRRVGPFIPIEEREELGLPMATQEETDAWWEGFSEENADGLARAIERCAPRFLAQEGIVSRVLDSRILGDHARRVAEVRSAVAAGRGLDEPPGLKTSKAVPRAWYRAASEVTRSESPHVHHRDGVKFLAEDAWCCEQVLR